MFTTETQCHQVKARYFGFDRHYNDIVADPAATV
jgi:hypothetical protein